MRSIVVVGGGIVGLSAGLALARDGHRVTLIDDSIGREAASWGNAGHIATEQVAPLASPATLRALPRRLFARGGAVDLPPRAVAAWAPFAWRLLRASTPRRFAAGRAALAPLLAEAMPAWHRLAAVIGRPELVRADGHFVLWESPATASAGRAAWAKADTGTATFRDAADAERAALQALAAVPIAGAIRCAGSGQIVDLDQLADALERAFAVAGGTIVRGEARLERDDGTVRVRGVPGELVLVAAGVRSAAPMAVAGHRVPLIAERGYHVRAAADRWPADLPPIVFEDRALIVTRYAESMQASGFVEYARVDTPADPRKWERLEAHVAALGLPVAEPFARWMGARPTLPDYLPAIGRSARAKNLLYAFGHQHLGLTLAPVTAELIAALARGESPGIDLRPYDIARFGRRAGG